MAATSTYDYRRETFTDSVDGASATEVWQVKDASTPAEALSATPEPNTRPIAKINESHPTRSNLKVRSVAATRTGFKTSDVTATYGVPPGGGDWVIIKSDDPVQQKPLITWGNGTIPVPTDTDAFGYPYVNSAGCAFNPLPVQYLKVKYLSIVVQKPGYTMAEYEKYEDSVNEDEVIIGGDKMLPGEVRCTTIQPVEGYTQGATSINVGFNFEILRVRQVLTAGTTPLRIQYPWNIFGRFKDQGSEGWATIDGAKKQGVFCYASTGSRVETDKPLNGSGRPIDPSIKVKANIADTGVSPEDSPGGYWPKGYLAGGDSLKIITFRQHRTQKFTDLKVLELV